MNNLPAYAPVEYGTFTFTVNVDPAFCCPAFSTLHFLILHFPSLQIGPSFSGHYIFSALAMAIPFLQLQLFPYFITSREQVHAGLSTIQ